MSQDVVSLRALGFCGVDDSVSIDALVAIAAHLPHVEWGVLFRPDKEGTPRYASPAYVEALAAANKAAGSPVRLAGHLCGERVNEVLRGDCAFVRRAHQLGFARVQVNATAINGVDVIDLPAKALKLRECMLAVPEVEWIIQRNDETKPLYEVLQRDPPPNMSLLFDASCGTGEWSFDGGLPPPHPTIPTGYAGGIGVGNVATTLDMVGAAMAKDARRTGQPPRPAWIDMESSLRGEVDGADVFSLDKCLACARRAEGHFVAAGAAAAGTRRCAASSTHCSALPSATALVAAAGAGAAAALLLSRLLR